MDKKKISRKGLSIIFKIQTYSNHIAEAAFSHYTTVRGIITSQISLSCVSIGRFCENIETLLKYKTFFSSLLYTRCTTVKVYDLKRIKITKTAPSLFITSLTVRVDMILKQKMPLLSRIKVIFILFIE